MGGLHGAALDALGDANRRAILEILATGERSVQQIADVLDISRPAVSRHLRLLKQAGLVVDRADGTRRVYQLHEAGVQAVREYFRELWSEAAARFRLAAENTEPRAVSEPTPIPPLLVEFRVAAPVAHAFEVWTKRTRLWWPPSHTVSGHPEQIVFEPRPGGRIVEVAPTGEQHRWGELLDWEPPNRLRFRWHLFFDPSEATDVEITFRADGDGTVVRLEQRGWDRLGDAGRARRDRTGQVWSVITRRYQAACGSAGQQGR